ncbi:MAG: ABC transporter permease [Candidatus Omnitrophica bacterium]|nr:ABC transporter permease [Candidatus Omnitrophota bacterium]
MKRATIVNKIIIEPTKGWACLKLQELWQYRELFYFLALRDIKVRYKQTFLGVSWALVNPLMQMFVWAFVFGVIAKFPSAGVPYVLITLSGTIAWNYFSEIVNGAGNAMLTNTNLISKIYFPRLIIPLSVVLRALLDFVIASVLLILMIFYFRVQLSLSIIFLPVFIILITLISSGVGLWAAAISVKFRDVGKILPYFIQTIFFLTPVAYLKAAIPQKYLWLYYLNPVAGAIDGLRWVFLGIPFSWNWLFLQVLISVIIFVSGLFYFKRLERTFADII